MKLFYEKLIKSNDIDNPTDVYQKITDQDIQQGTIENKVNMDLKHIDYMFYFIE